MQKSILIVDDNPDMSSLLSEMLEVFDYHAERADSGQQALQVLESGKFSMVITDMRMPQMSGLELIQEVKRRHPKLPIVLISGYNVADSEAEAAGAKPDGFLPKPFMMSDIESLLEKLL